MKKIIALLLAFLPAVVCQSQTVSGTVTDGHEPLTGANIWEEGTINGCLTDSAGCFSFEASGRDTIIICATCLGFDPVRLTLARNAAVNVNIRMKEQALGLKEVVITGSGYHFGNTGETRSMSALDVVLEGNSNGDVVAAMQMLPGTQKVGEDGKLYVRGGSNDECQTFVNGMHVLEPYTVHSGNNAVRGRFSPFLFKGMNFSLGGYSAEYGQALSAVLPMETTDRQTSDKFGVSASVMDWNAGGTKVFGQSSLSLNAAYANLRPYYNVVHNSLDWSHPVESFSGETQLKTDLNDQWQWKTYLGYDYTTLGINNFEDRNLRMRQQNLYANSTIRGILNSDWVLFFGAAGGIISDRMNGAIVTNDRYNRDHYEIHLKATAKKYIGKSWCLMGGAEDYIRKNKLGYIPAQSSLYSIAKDMGEAELRYQVPAVFADAQVRLVRSLYLRFSSRLEANTYDNDWTYMPRFSLSYVPSKQFQVSILGGRYSQMSNDDYVAQYDKSSTTNIKAQATADHAIASAQYSKGDATVRLEGYYKRYHHLPRYTPYLHSFDDGIFTSDGHGISKGIDFFAENYWLDKHLFARVSYSYNDSKRNLLPELGAAYTSEEMHQTDYWERQQMPAYVSRHNIRLSLRYAFCQTFSMSLADSYASHRLSEGRKTPIYNSLDASLTWLANKKVIVYASCSNILGRKNVYGYHNGKPIMNSTRTGFYIGVFISLKSNKAYDISNF